MHRSSSEFNHVRDSAGKCVLVPGAVSLSSENTCIGDDEFWYERTAYRKISKSLCENGNRLDQGTAHHCHGHWFKTFVSRFWWTFITLPVGIIALLAVWYYRRRGPRRGYVLLPLMLLLHSDATTRAIHLPDSDEAPDSPSPFRAKLASIPSVVAEGMANFWNYLKSFPGISMSLFGSRRRTQEVALEDDA
jgi:Sortilin, neurotensin receptor 3, C-terminal